MAVYKDNATGTWYAHGKYRNALGNIEWYKKRGFRTKGEASKWERERLTCGSPANITFDDLAEMYFSILQKHTKQSSYKSQHYKYLKLIKPYLADKKLSKINSLDISKWQIAILDATYEKNNQYVPYSNKYLEGIQSLVKSIIKYGIDYELINNSKLLYFNNIYHADQKKKEMLFWEPKEFSKFIKVINNQEDRAFFYTLYMSGLRLGEICALTWNDINFKESSITVNKQYNNHTQSITSPKTKNSYRTVLMSKDSMNELKMHYNNCLSFEGFSMDKYLFGFDKPLDDNTVRRRKEKYAEIAEVKNIRIHDFRHSHVSLLISLGFSSYDISKRIGNTPEMINKVYAHWFDSSQKKMVSKLNKIKF